jgi:S-(hydroxymethyl)glutathione dehydrogenase/alcohol dehydrogenase
MCQRGHISVCDEVPSTMSLPTSPDTGTGINQLVGLGGFATHTVVPEWAAVSVDRDVPFPQKALVGCAVTTGVGAVINTAKVEQGSSVAVFGCGGVGLNCIQGAKIAGADKIIAVDIKDNKLDMAIEFGATHTVNSHNQDPVEKIRELTDGLGSHYSFEAIGIVEQTLIQSVECTRKKGVTVWVGAPPVGLDVTLDSRALVFEKSILGSYYGSARPHIDFPKLLKLYKAGHLKLDELLSQSHPIEDVNLAFEAMQRGEVARSVITFD